MRDSALEGASSSNPFLCGTKSLVLHASFAGTMIPGEDTKKSLLTEHYNCETNTDESTGKSFGRPVTSPLRRPIRHQSLQILIMLSYALTLCVKVRSFTMHWGIRTVANSRASRRGRPVTAPLSSRNPRQGYSLDDLRYDDERGFPPSMDSSMDDEGFGAYDYRPDANELESLEDSFDPALAGDEFAAPAKFVEEPIAHIKLRPVQTDGTSSGGVLKRSVTKLSNAPPSVLKKPNATVPVASVEPPQASVASPPASSSPNPEQMMFKIQNETKDTPKDQLDASSFEAIEEEYVDDTGFGSRWEAAPLPAKPKATVSPAPLAVRPKSKRDEGGVIPATHVHAAQATEQFVVRASSGNGASSELDMLQARLANLEQDIYAQNKCKEFNINSPKQVSEILFGYIGESTNKDVLDSMAGGGNRMAKLILDHRSVKQGIKRLKRKVLTKESGTLVKSVSTVVRPVTDSKPQEKTSDPLILVDASAYIFRAYYSMPPIHRSDGMPTGAVMGFCSMIMRLILNRIVEGERPRLVLVFDAKGKTFRHSLYPEYKGNRPDAPVDLVPQFALVREAAKAYGIPQIEAATFEADDVIATLATMAIEEGIDTNILSGDKDLWQLITDREEIPSVHMIDPMTMGRITYDEVVEKWGCGPRLLGDILALAGDSADNVPGVPGIGPKIAALLIEEFGSLEKLLANVDTVKQRARREKLKANEQQARLSRVLVDLRRDVPMDRMTFPQGIAKVSDLQMAEFDSNRILAFYDAMGFRDLKRRFENRLNQSTTKRGNAKSSRPPKTTIPTPDDYADVPF
jgi:5'-3' exonuclease